MADYTVSIHAPAWGATSQSFSFSLSAMRFQSTHPRGVRLCHDGQGRLLRGVSIHAPAWGATFQKASHLLSRSRFQSTHPRGVRRPFFRLPRPLLRVSIHAPAWGATWGHDRSKAILGVSIHAPAWGATAKWTVKSFIQCRGFNPRTRVGCDSIASSIGTLPVSFNPRTRVGCDTSSLTIS